MRIAPELPADDVEKSAMQYEQKLGFVVAMENSAPTGNVARLAQLELYWPGRNPPKRET